MGRSKGRRKGEGKEFDYDSTKFVLSLLANIFHFYYCYRRTVFTQGQSSIVRGNMTAKIQPSEFWCYRKQRFINTWSNRQIYCVKSIWVEGPLDTECLSLCNLKSLCFWTQCPALLVLSTCYLILKIIINDGYWGSPVKITHCSCRGRYSSSKHPGHKAQKLQQL